MNIVLSLAAAGLFIELTAASLKKYAVHFYYCSVILSVIVVAVTWSEAYTVFPALVRYQVWPMFSNAGFATALFIFVMYGGAVQASTKFLQTVMRNRGELSIVASILTLGHNISYGKTYFFMLFTNMYGLNWNQAAAAVCSLLMVLIMLPLFITSFPAIRKMLQAKKWKRLQRCAYAFYALIYIHVLLLMLEKAREGNTKYALNILLYSLLFIGYAGLRICRALARKSAGRIYRTIVVLLAGALFLYINLPCFIAVLHPAQSSEGQEVWLPASQPEDNTENPADVQTAGKAASVQDDPLKEQAGNGLLKGKPAGSEDLFPAGQPVAAPPAETYENGIYAGSASAYEGKIEVEVTVEEGRIAEIRIVSCKDDPEYMDKAKVVIRDILERGSTEGVDAVSGATVSSKAIIKAVEKALSRAG